MIQDFIDSLFLNTSLLLILLNEVFHTDKFFLPAYVVASFKVQKPVSLLNANIAKLQYDIFEEIGVPNSSVPSSYLLVPSIQIYNVNMI